MVSNENEDDVLGQEYIGAGTSSDTTVNSTTSNVAQQTFITRVFHEKDNQVIGAEVIIYDDDGHRIDSIIVTDKTSLEEFQEKWKNISNYYVVNEDVSLPSDLQEKVDNGELTTLQDILKNSNNTTRINATTLNGIYTGDNFSLIDHDHDDKYCIMKHQSSTQDYGVATSSLYGHSRIVDHLKDATFNEATALSSHQGYELNNKINNLKNKFQWSGVTQVGDYIKYRVNPDLRLMIVNYNRLDYTGCKKTTGNHKLHPAGTIPAAYAPTSRVSTPLYRGDFVLYYNTNGTVNLYNLTTKATINIHAQVMWHF